MEVSRVKRKNLFILFAVLASLVLVLAACGGGDNNNDNNNNDNTNVENNNNNDNNNNDGNVAEGDSDFKVAMVTDVGGVDDKSFNQSAWEGLQAWGEEHGLEEKENFDYAQSDDDADYLPNLNSLVRDEFDLIFGIGYLLEPAVEEIAQNNPDTYFSIVDAVVEEDNVASITFADNESSFLVGVAAALKTETDKLGFVGGVESDIITAFDVGFYAGVKSINPDIEIDIQYAEAFDAADKGKLIASQMYNNDIDIIFHASGDTGNGVFSEAKDIKNSDPDREIWVIGVDQDQYEEGQIGDYNVTLTSALKRVDNAVQQVSNMAMDGDFPGGEVLAFDLSDEGVGYATTNEDALTSDIIEEMEEWKEKIINGEVDVPSTQEELEEYLESL
ncbi:MAG TPA: BMP family ABC transporter substrate-binding protein [Bacillota bacterium]|nr:BMP family ABC transporter substrate-binding protein [Bacillota bacterium]